MEHVATEVGDLGGVNVDTSDAVPVSAKHEPATRPTCPVPVRRISGGQDRGGTAA